MRQLCNVTIHRVKASVLGVVVVLSVVVKVDVLCGGGGGVVQMWLLL